MHDRPVSLHEHAVLQLASLTAWLRARTLVRVAEAYTEAAASAGSELELLLAQANTRRALLMSAHFEHLAEAIDGHLLTRVSGAMLAVVDL